MNHIRESRTSAWLDSCTNVSYRQPLVPAVGKDLNTYLRSNGDVGGSPDQESFSPAGSSLTEHRQQAPGTLERELQVGLTQGHDIFGSNLLSNDI